jgi:ribosomal protein S18 acetylase RimI-like enzyme
MSEIEIRLAAYADVPAVVALWHEVVEHHAALCPEFAPTADADALHAAHLAQGLASDDRAVFVAHHQGTAVGFLSIRAAPLPPVFVGCRKAEVTDLGVTRAFRRRGIGRALWRHAVAWSRGRGFEQIELGVLAGNDGARRFWTGVGFTPKFEHMKFAL